MRGYPRFNFDAFDHARDVLNSQGHEAVSPADLDRDAGLNPDLPLPEGFNLRDCIMRDINAILTCDGIVLLDRWQDSKGVAVEKALAEFLGLKVFFFVNDSLVPVVHLQ
jgi:hypothetical protein